MESDIINWEMTRRFEKLINFMRKKKREEAKRNKCTIGCYHYVDKKDFEAHVKEIMKKYKVITMEDYFNGINEKSYIFTFDDGLKDHYNNAFPILKKYGITGYFFIVTCTLDGKMPDVFKQHLIFRDMDKGTNKENQKGEEFRERWNKIVNRISLIVKLIPRPIKNYILNKKFKKICSDEKKICQEFFITQDEILEMKKEGMVFGSHSHTHPFLSRLSNRVQFKEMFLSKRKIESLLNENIKCIVYPFNDYNKKTLKLANSIGYKWGYGKGNLGKEKFNIKRIDIKLGVENV